MLEDLTRSLQRPESGSQREIARVGGTRVRPPALRACPHRGELLAEELVVVVELHAPRAPHGEPGPEAVPEGSLDAVDPRRAEGVRREQRRDDLQERDLVGLREWAGARAGAHAWASVGELAPAASARHARQATGGSVPPRSPPYPEESRGGGRLRAPAR